MTTTSSLTTSIIFGQQAVVSDRCAGTSRVGSKSALNLSNDLFAQPNNSTLDYQQNDTSHNSACDSFPLCLFAQYLVTSEIDSLLDPDFSVQSSALLLVNSTNSDISSRNYHLQAFVQDGVVTTSPAIDFAPAISGEGNDLDNNPRDQDVPLIPNRFGLSDVGAYEMQPIPPISDRIFADRFGATLPHWCIEMVAIFRFAAAISGARRSGNARRFGLKTTGSFLSRYLHRSMSH